MSIFNMLFDLQPLKDHENWYAVFHIYMWHCLADKQVPSKQTVQDQINRT